MARTHGQTARHRRLSAELKRMREEAGISSAEVAERMGWNQTKVNRLERGEWKRLKEDDLRRLTKLYGVNDPEKQEALVSMARQASAKGWWARYSDVLGSGAYVALESTTSGLRFYGGMLVPGLLQTQNYAKAIIHGYGVSDAAEIQRRLEARLLRQELLEQQDRSIHAVIDEAALRKDIGGRLTMSEQLIHLCLLNQKDNVTVRVLPDSVGAHPGLGGHFVILDFPHEQDEPVVFIDDAHNGLFLEEPEEIASYTMIYDSIRDLSLSVEESDAYMKKIIDQLME
ncbi:MAG: helix-turn-helix transcriptional regulator [Nocardiopsaceae bacterium]|nr:helix-turn-helix transcriptional regulator [Nocardiopsaceae bacterium]